MAATSYRYLVNLPGVCQGKTIVEGTRIGVHDVVGLILNGASVDDVCRSFPDLSRPKSTSVWLITKIIAPRLMPWWPNR